MDQFCFNEKSESIDSYTACFDKLFNILLTSKSLNNTELIMAKIKNITKLLEEI